MGEHATELSAFAVPAGTITFLLTDVEGSTRLWEAAPAAMPVAIARHYVLLDEAIARHDGVRPVEQGEGDSIVAAFTRAGDAVAAALDAQRALLAEDWPEGAALRVRMALHTGDAQVRDEGNYFGAAVIRCARLRAVAHGGQALLSAATAELVADRLPDGADLVNLGVHRLRDLGRPERVFALAHPDLPGGAPPPRSLDQLPNNLPVQLTSFVGRDRELAELDKLLDATRLLTLTGGGGCGKTRLSLQLAADALDRYPDGAWWLALAPLSDPALIESALATVVGVRPLPGQTSLQAAVLQLAAHTALVLLDNCEHVLDACATIADAVLHGCPNVTVVATSREPLGLGGETTWRVPSLSLPAARTSEALQSLAQSDAVRLFIERAIKVRPNFTVTNDTAPHVAQICQNLDGIPLAIELAAARVRVLSVERIAAGLADRFHLLTGGARGAVPRLQTLRASVDWSHDLLDDDERTLLRRLGVFHGGFTLDACEAVCAGDDLDRYAILDLLTSLVDKSLVIVEERGSASRYGLLETVRHYALDRLDEAGEADELRRRHVNVFLALAEGSAPTEARWDDVLAADAANLYAAIDHAASTEPPTALRLCVALAYWWDVTARLAEGTTALGLALDATDGECSAMRGRALTWRGYLAWFAGEYDRAELDATAALALAAELGDQAVEAHALNLAGLFESAGDPRGALPTFERSRELARATGEDWCLAEAAQNVGWSLLMAGEFDRAREELEASHDVAARNGFREAVVWHWFMLGHIVHPRGDGTTARALWERCCEGNEIQYGLATWSLALVDVDEGRPADALERLAAGRRRGVAAGAGLALPFLDLGVAQAHAAHGRLDEARDGLIEAVREQAEGFVWGEALALLDLSHVERLRGDHAAARASADEALVVADHLGNATFAARARQRLAIAAAADGDWAAAEHLAHDALASQAERGDRLDLPDSLDTLAEIAAGLESHEEAARLLGACDHARTEIVRVRWAPEQERTDALAQRLREELGDETYEAAYAEGEALTLDDAIAYVRRARGKRKRPSGGWESLTPTELQVIRHAAAGLTNPEIGERMFISRGTVKVHLSHIYAKLGLRNRAEVTAEATHRMSAASQLDHQQ
jgi:predicted ATPase/class 3 adenylate cyclase/DNA-binding CsgD family transcriptional regulator